MRSFAATFFMLVVGTIVGCCSLRTSESEVPSISGNWRIHQTNVGGQEFTGTLTLNQTGSEFSGSVIWDGRGRASITNGIVSNALSQEQGAIVSFVIAYDGELRGKYYATLSANQKTLLDGATVVIHGGNDSGMWSATLIEE